MTPTIEHALAKFQNAPKERKEKVAQMILVELQDVRDEYQEFVDRQLAEGLADIKAGRITPAEEFIPEFQARMKAKYGFL